MVLVMFHKSVVVVFFLVTFSGHYPVIFVLVTFSDGFSDVTNQLLYCSEV